MIYLVGMGLLLLAGTIVSALLWRYLSPAGWYLFQLHLGELERLSTEALLLLLEKRPAELQRHISTALLTRDFGPTSCLAKKIAALGPRANLFAPLIREKFESHPKIEYLFALSRIDPAGFRSVREMHEAALPALREEASQLRSQVEAVELCADEALAIRLARAERDEETARKALSLISEVVGDDFGGWGGQHTEPKVGHEGEYERLGYEFDEASTERRRAFTAVQEDLDRKARSIAGASYATLKTSLHRAELEISLRQILSDIARHFEDEELAPEEAHRLLTPRSCAITNNQLQRLFIEFGGYTRL